MKSVALTDNQLSRVYLLILGIAFVTLTALRLNGSSVVRWSVILGEEKTSQALVYSVPRTIRSDEWLVWTPSVLAQARHQPSFPIENPALGAGRSPMLMNLPTRHYSTFFRPQLWGYFLFDIEHGFAWHWNVKIFGLLAAMFLLIRRLTDGSFWLALLGSVWVYASSYTQWWFSCPPMLPEMLASWALAIWGVLRLSTAPRWPVALPVTGAVVVGTVNFALCMYPPYQLPLVYLGLAVLGGYLWQQRATSSGLGKWQSSAVWLGLAGGAVALIIIPFFLELMPSLHLVQNTSYPGARRTIGGALSAVQLFSGFADPFMTADAIPEKLGNPCGASNFYPLWLAAGCWLIVATAAGTITHWRQLWPLQVTLLGFTVFALCKLPPFVGAVTLLSFSTEERLILPIGLGGILLSILVLREMATAARLATSWKLAAFVVFAGLASMALLSASTASPLFFSPWTLTAIFALTLSLGALYLFSARRIFALVLIGALLPPALRVNPVTEGLAPLTESSALPLIEEIRKADPDARWLSFDGANQAAFLTAAGVDVLSGAKTLPDLAFYREIDPAGTSNEIYNRYSLGIFQASPEPDLVQFKLFNFCSHQVLISPGHPTLRRWQVRYFTFPKPLPDPGIFGLQAFKSVPERQLWIYKLRET